MLRHNHILISQQLYVCPLHRRDNIICPRAEETCLFMSSPGYNVQIKSIRRHKEQCLNPQLHPEAVMWLYGLSLHSTNVKARLGFLLNQFEHLVVVPFCFWGSHICKSHEAESLEITLHVLSFLRCLQIINNIET